MLCVVYIYETCRTTHVGQIDGRSLHAVYLKTAVIQPHAFLVLLSAGYGSKCNPTIEKLDVLESFSTPRAVYLLVWWFVLAPQSIYES